MIKRAYILLLVMGMIGRVQGKPDGNEIKEKQEENFSVVKDKNKYYMRHLEGMKGLGLVGGISSIGLVGGMEWSWLMRASSQLKIIGGMEWKTIPYISYKMFFLKPMYYHTVYANYDNFWFNIGGGLIGIYTRKYAEKVDKIVTSYNLGVVVGGEVELYIIKAVEVTLSGGPVIYIFKDSYDRISYFLNVGLKFNF